MGDPKSSPAYLARCVYAFLEALREAEALSVAGEVGFELAETLRFANDLLDIRRWPKQPSDGSSGSG